MASFQAKIDCKRQRREKRKIIIPFRPYLTQNLKLQNNSKNKNKKKKKPVWLHLKPEQVGKGRERKKINIVVLFRSYPTPNRKFQKNSNKLKNTIMAPFEATIG